MMEGVDVTVQRTALNNLVFEFTDRLTGDRVQLHLSNLDADKLGNNLIRAAGTSFEATA
jgi:hypothetical protein